MVHGRPPGRFALWRGLFAVPILWVCVTACSGERPGPAAAEPFTLRLGAALPQPGVPGTGVPAVVRTLFAESALAIHRNGRVQSRLFEDWEWQDGGQTLRLTLTPGIRFHDGSPLTPQVAAAILERHVARRDAFTFEAVTRVEAHEDFVDIHLRSPEPLLPDDLAAVEFTKGPGGNVGTGPFMLEGGQPPTKEGGRLVAFPGYRLGRPQIGGIEVKGYPTLRAAWTAMMRGEINMLHEVSNDAAHFAEAEPNLLTYPLVRPYIYFVAFNMRHPALKRREVRQALSQAVDRAAIIRDAMKGRGEIAEGPVWKYHWAYSTAQRSHQFNPEAANLRLDAAGLPRDRRAAPGRMPSRFRFTCLMFGEDPRFERIALVLQKQLYNVGVDMEIEALPLRQLVERMRSGDFDAFLLEVISGRSLTWLYRIWRSHPKAVQGEFDSGYAAADATLERLRRAFTEAEIRSAVSEVQRVLYEDPPALFLAWPTTSRAISADISVPYEPNMDILARIARFERAPGGVARR